jgi:hypothetical protein
LLSLSDYKKSYLIKKGDNMDSQKKMILIHLQMNDTITTYEAFKKFQCTRLSAIIFLLKQDGHNISKTMETKNGKTYALYRLYVEDKNKQFSLV